MTTSTSSTNFFRFTVICFAALIASCASAPKPDWFDEKKAHHTVTDDGGYAFKNVHLEDTDKTFFDFLRMRFGGDEAWADPFANNSALAKQVRTQPVDINLINNPTERPQVTWLGHSSFLIQYQNFNILTDPIFADRASPVSFAGPKRYVPHVIDYEELPPIDIVVISHNHYDHLDKLATQILGDTPMYYVPLGLAQWYESQGVASDRVIEMDWWQTQKFTQNIAIKALPSQHWSARGLNDRFESLWASWAIQFNDFTLWFGGDTGYNEHVFTPIGDHLEQVDLALIPIGAYAPRWFMKDYHADPTEAVKIHQDVNAKFSVGMHWGTFPLTAEPPIEPAAKLRTALNTLSVSPDDFITLDIGQSISIDE